MSHTHEIRLSRFELVLCGGVGAEQLLRPSRMPVKKSLPMEDRELKLVSGWSGLVGVALGLGTLVL
jgi:hypothetical protein